MSEIKSISVSKVLKEEIENRFIGIIDVSNAKGFIANTGGHLSLLTWGISEQHINLWGKPFSTQKDVIRNYRFGIKEVFIFNDFKELFSWMAV